MSELQSQVAGLGDTLKGLPYEEREKTLRQLQLIVAAGAPAEALEEPAPIRSLGDYLENPPPVPPELVTPKFLVRGGLTVTAGRAGYGKTSIHLNRLMPWAAGEPMFERLKTAFVPEKPLRILVIENEGAGGEFYKKIKTMLDHSRFDAAQRELIKKNLLIWGEGGYAGVRIDNEKSLKTVQRGIEEWEPDVVLLEPFSRIHDKNENDNSEMNQVGSVLEEMAVKYSIGIMLAHHEGKGHRDSEEKMDRQRGASSLEGWTTFMETLEQAKGGAQRELVSTKSRYGEKPPPTRFEWKDHGWYDYVAPERGVAEIIAELDADQPRFVADLAEELGEHQHRIRTLLKKAEEAGQVKSLPGMSTGAGSTGKGWILRTAETAEEERVGF